MLAFQLPIPAQYNILEIITGLRITMPFEFGPNHEPRKYRLECDGLFANGVRKRLGTISVGLLNRLVLNRPRVLSHRKLFEGCQSSSHWSNDEDHFARDHISAIRRALRPDNDAIATERSIGYYFAWEVNPADSQSTKATR
jgi:DNA-binding winged helix-turn-helix (wHTH) protein